MADQNHEALERVAFRIKQQFPHMPHEEARGKARAAIERVERKAQAKRSR